ncbi:hypothetical protein phi18_069 [Bacillus phage phi18]|nr:putative membrane-bound protein [Bacillus phage vB_BsuM-Goe9]UAV84339.1 hypothetical protein phi18_069 [Bacillus phage phi18]WIT26597.1 hypothetical protein [Bacillus phage SPO1L5]
MTTFLLILSLGVAFPTTIYVLLAVLTLVLDRNYQITKRTTAVYICFLLSWAVAIQTFVGWG